ncbi:MAG: S-layer homology domain-containing protein [Clostridia bacterium]|nr:S-layer homology domain-containing protein [Clostridia bacterium]
MKRLTSVLLILLLLAGAVPAFAADAVISGQAGNASPGETVTVTLDLTGNPGVAAWSLTLEWDADVLRLEEQGLALSDTFSNGFLASNSDAEGQLRLAWAGLSDVTGDGTLVTLTFRVAEDAEANSGIVKVSAGGVSNENGQAVAVSTEQVRVPIRQTDGGEARPAEPETPKEDTPMTPMFTDLSAEAYYYKAALWAAEQGITTGTAPGVFSPDAPCSRAQAVTFLWRAEGCPEPAAAENPFTDVSADAYYYKAVLWAVERGITKGTGDGSTFRPEEPCTRAQIVTFLYRNVQAEGGGFQGAWMFYIPFRDLPDWAFESIAWCYMKGITTGTGETTFSPDAVCSRGQIVTFLYRAFAETEIG